jgi:hypothetical protein
MLAALAAAEALAVLDLPVTRPHLAETAPQIPAVAAAAVAAHRVAVLEAPAAPAS